MPGDNGNDVTIRIELASICSQDANAQVDDNAQANIEDTEAASQVWEDHVLIMAMGAIWTIYCAHNLLASMTEAVAPYAASTFSYHSLTPAVGIMSSILSGVNILTLSKVLEAFGRPRGYFFCMLIVTLGMALTAGSRRVELYSIGQIFQAVGHNGILYCLSVIVADNSTLRNQGLVQAVVGTSNLFIGFFAGPIASVVLDGSGWRWSFSVFAVVVPCVSLALLGILVSNHNKAERLGLVKKSGRNQGLVQSFCRHCSEFDYFGLVLLASSIALFLFPFHIYNMEERGWTSPPVLGMLIADVFAIVALALWEKFFAPFNFISFSLLLDGTMLSACIVSAMIFAGSSIWRPFFLSYLQVVNNLEVHKAAYTLQAYSVTSTIAGVVSGILVRQTGRFKMVTIIGGLPLSIFSMFFIMKLGEAERETGYVIMCLILTAAATETILICNQVAMLAAGARHHAAKCLAMLGIFGSIGSAVGYTVASAVWQKTLPAKLLKYLPEADLPNLAMIYADLSTQLSFPMDSPTRRAIQHAYINTYTRLLVACIFIWIIGLVMVFCWRNMNVIGMKRVKGHVW